MCATIFTKADEEAVLTEFANIVARLAISIRRNVTVSPEVSRNTPPPPRSAARRALSLHVPQRPPVAAAKRHHRPTERPQRGRCCLSCATTTNASSRPRLLLYCSIPATMATMATSSCRDSLRRCFHHQRRAYLRCLSLSPPLSSQLRRHPATSTTRQYRTAKLGTLRTIDQCWATLRKKDGRSTPNCYPAPTTPC